MADGETKQCGEFGLVTNLLCESIFFQRGRHFWRLSLILILSANFVCKLEFLVSPFVVMYLYSPCSVQLWNCVCVCVCGSFMGIWFYCAECQLFFWFSVAERAGDESSRHEAWTYLWCPGSLLVVWTSPMALALFLCPVHSWRFWNLYECTCTVCSVLPFMVKGSTTLNSWGGRLLT